MPSYEFSAKKHRAEKAVATVVDAVPSKEVEKAVAEEVKVADPVNAEEVIKKAEVKKPEVKKVEKPVEKPKEVKKEEKPVEVVEEKEKAEDVKVEDSADKNYKGEDAV